MILLRNSSLRSHIARSKLFTVRRRPNLLRHEHRLSRPSLPSIRLRTFMASSESHSDAFSVLLSKTLSHSPYSQGPLQLFRRRFLSTSSLMRFSMGGLSEFSTCSPTSYRASILHSFERMSFAQTPLGGLDVSWRQF